MITLIFPYRNRDTERIKKSLNSLKNQTSNKFKVIFVDFGTQQPLAGKIKDLVCSYSFVTYFYTYEINKPWNKSRAINIALNNITTDYVFIADVDLIFNPRFIEVISQLCHPERVTYFKVGYLNAEETLKNINFNDYLIKHYSDKDATGLSLFPTEKLKGINGFDEFFHFWGSEDTDAHNRIINYNVEVVYHSKELLLLHQNHQIYIQPEDDILTTNLRCKNIVRINYNYQLFNKNNKITKTSKNYGELVTLHQYNQLKKIDLNFEIYSDCISVDYFQTLLFMIKDKVVQFNFKNKKISLKERIKAVLGKSEIIKLLPLKEVNDLILKLIIFNFSNNIYSFEVDVNKEELKLIIKL